MRFEIEGAGTAGTATLFIDDEPVGQMRLAETFEFFVAFEGLDVGADGLSPVRENGDGPFAFEGGLDKVTIELLSGVERRAHEPTG
jgi:arylsulfatase